MSSVNRWRDTEHVQRAAETAGGQESFDPAVGQMLDRARGWRLAELRKRREMTQEQVAARMGISVSRVSQIENGDVSTQDVLVILDTRSLDVFAMEPVTCRWVDFGHAILLVMPKHEPAPPRLVTPRIEVRHVVEADRPRFVELFCDESFMEFSDGALSPGEANERFDQMIVRCTEVSFAKQPIVERSSGAVIGYTGVDWIELDDRRWLEWGYRLARAARGKGYATEASDLLLTAASTLYSGDILAIIHADNQPSQNVSRKLGFRYWKTASVVGEVRNLYRLRLQDGARHTVEPTGWDA